MAGIWENYLAPDGTDIDTLALMTTSANDTLGELHHRMPVIIEQADFDRWLGTPPEDAGSLQDLLCPAREDFFTAWPVDKRVGRVGEDDPDIIKPIGPRLGEEGPAFEDELDSDDANPEKDGDDQFRLL